MNTPVKDMIGQVFGNLTVLAREGTIRTFAAWRCRCTCGKEVVVTGGLLREGRRKSCAVDGHFYRSAHGSLVRQYPREYQSWKSMRQRCLNTRQHNYVSYGGAGVTIHPRWRSFANFIADMGPKPTSEHSIDRYPDNAGNYEPGNCRWATLDDQARNKKNNVYVEYEGKRMLLIDVCRQLGVDRNRVYQRVVANGWSLEKALSKAVRRKRCNRKKSEGANELAKNL